MKFKRIQEPGNRTGYEAVLSEYDSIPPSNKIIVDELPEKVDPNREAIALYLIFGKWVGSDFTVPQWMSPHTGETIARAASPITVSPSPFEYYPKGLPIGNRELFCTDSSEFENEQGTVAVLPAHSWSGALRGFDSIAVSSNAFVFQEDQKDVAPLVGIALLFAEDLNADSICIRTKLPEAEESRIAALLSSVRLGFKIVED